MTCGRMSEFPWDSVFTLVGVTLGFALSQVVDASKSRTRKNLIRRALHNELEVAYVSFVKALPRSRLAFEDYPLITDTYDSVKVELAAMLDPSKLALVERAYHQIKTLNKPMDKDTPRGYMMIPMGGLLYQHDLSEDIKVIWQGISALGDTSLSFTAAFQIVLRKLGLAELLRKGFTDK